MYVKVSDPNICIGQNVPSQSIIEYCIVAITRILSYFSKSMIHPSKTPLPHPCSCKILRQCFMFPYLNAQSLPICAQLSIMTSLQAPISPPYASRSNTSILLIQVSGQSRNTPCTSFICACHSSSKIVSRL